jgi:hypothetical protein
VEIDRIDRMVDGLRKQLKALVATRLQATSRTAVMQPD